MVDKKLKNIIDKMSDNEREKLLKALGVDGWVSLKVKNNRVIEGKIEKTTFERL